MGANVDKIPKFRRCQMHVFEICGCHGTTRTYANALSVNDNSQNLLVFKLRAFVALYQKILVDEHKITMTYFLFITGSLLYEF